MSTPLLSLAICTYQRPLAVDRLLSAVSRQSRMPDETLVVDASPDTATEVIVQSWQAKEALPSLAYERASPKNRGLTRQRNYAVARARGRIIAFLDDDTVPEPSYFREVLACFERHPKAVGVGGYVVDGTDWRRVASEHPPRSFGYRWGQWERGENYRWRLRKILGLVENVPPGWMPPSGHGRHIGFLAPDGNDHQVEYLMGCAFAWRREVFERHKFPHEFEGYGLYEDLDFCIRASRDAPLYLCTRALLRHCQESAGRPNHFRYGEMVVRNGWSVWRRRWPHPSRAARLRWWSITVLLALCRLVDLRGPAKRQAILDGLGRFYGVLRLLSGA